MNPGVVLDKMPGIVNENICIKKRKHVDALPRQDGTSTKRKKQSKKRDEDNIHAEILLLESQIVGSRLHYNDISKLLEYVPSHNQQDERDVVAAVALCRVFCKLMAQESMTASPQAPENETTIIKWLLQRYQEYQDALVSLFTADAHRQSTALTLIMKLVKVEAAELKLPEQSIWHSGIFSKLIAALAQTTEAKEARAEFGDKYLEEYHDVRYYTLLNLS